MPTELIMFFNYWLKKWLKNTNAVQSFENSHGESKLSSIKINCYFTIHVYIINSIFFTT